MKLVLADATSLKVGVSVISDLVSEARFKVTRDAVELVAMDPANVAMVVFKLLSTAFTEYSVDKEQELGLSLTNFNQILRRVKANDVLTLELMPDNRLQVQLKSASTRTFSLPLLDMAEREQKVPSLNFPVTITAPSSVLTDAVEDAGIVAESITFAAEPEKLTVQAEGDLNKAHVQINQGEGVKIQSDTKATVKSKYSIEYLKKIIQGTKLSDEVTVQFSQDYPLKVEYKVIDKLLLSFILAPRVEND